VTVEQHSDKLDKPRWSNICVTLSVLLQEAQLLLRQLALR